MKKKTSKGENTYQPKPSKQKLLLEVEANFKYSEGDMERLGLKVYKSWSARIQQKDILLFGAKLKKNGQKSWNKWMISAQFYSCSFSVALFPL